MNGQELQEWKERLQAEAWADYCLIRGYIERRFEEIAAADYECPIEDLVNLLTIAQQNDSYIRAAFGLPLVIKQKKTRPKGQVASFEIVISHEG